MLDDPLKEGPLQKFEDIVSLRGRAVARGLMGGDGTVDLTTDTAFNAIGDSLYNPAMSSAPTPAFTKHLVKTIGLLEDPGNLQTVNDTLANMSDPSGVPSSETLVRKALKLKDEDAVGKEQGQLSVLGAMLRPMAQGKVGSCFATAPTLRKSETDPLATMEMYAEIVGTGSLTPPFGPPVPCVTNLPDGGDPIQRSLEFTVATSAGRKDGSTQKKNFASGSEKGIVGIAKKLTDKRLEGVDRNLPLNARQVDRETKAGTRALRNLRGDIANAFTVTYDPTVEVKDANDGSSDKGRYQLIRKGIDPTGSDDEVIDSQAKYLSAMEKVALDSLGVERDSAEGIEVLAYINSPEFLTATTTDKYKPWARSSGGYTDEATKVLHGDGLTQKKMSTAVPETGTKPKEGDRTVTVLEDFMDALGNSGDDMVTIRTVGMHGFNALPTDPSLDPLRGSSKQEIRDKVKTNLIDVGTALKDTAIPLDSAQEMFDSQLAALIKAEKDGEVKALLETGARDERPALPLKPAELAEAVKRATAAANQKRADKEAETWEQKETEKGTPPTSEQKTERIEQSKKRAADGIDSGLLNKMMKRLKVPEFKLADTNWGSTLDHSFFVIAPDPRTGEPALWSRSDPPGKLSKMDRKWVDAEWAQIS